MDELSVILGIAGLEKVFEGQRRNIGAAHGLRNEITSLSKQGIVALRKGDSKKVAFCVAEIQKLWERLGKLDLPGDIAWGFDSEGGQEIVEFFVVKTFYDFLVNAKGGGIEISKPDDWGVTPQAWLAGIGDAVTELGKVLRVYLLNKSLSKKERSEARERFLKIAETLYDFLGQFEDVVPMVINNSRRKGYGNTYRGLLGRIEGLIERIQEQLIRLLDEEGGAR